METFTWFESCCFSTIIIANDSFAIHNIIYRIPEKLMFQNIIQGESILMVGMGLSYYRIFEEIHSNQDLHSTMLVFDIIKELFGGVFVSLGVFYIFNKFRARLIESKFLFGVLIVVICFYVCEVYLSVNGLIAVTILGIVLIVRYKSGTEERYNHKLINLTSNYIVVVACLILGYMDYQNE
jgi:NhaP-type Na+/H+ or K+/H+ antiporter